MSPQQIEKQQFRNATDGYIGAVQLSVKGEELGVAVEPGGTVWLSEAEQILTANAPRLPEHNPFIPQTMQRRNPETDALEDVQVTPLVRINEGRFVPANERPISSDLEDAPPPVEGEPTTPVPADLPEGEAPPAQAHEEAVVESGEDTAPGTVPPPPRAAQAAAAAEEAPAPSEADSEPQTPAGPPPPSAPLPPAADPSVNVPEDEGRVTQEAPAEETAAVSPGPASEETGAALTPSGDAPEGHYTAGEEVGTPQAPASGETAASDSSAPAPWSPGEE